MTRVERGGTYFRVCGRAWIDPLDTSYSRRHGGRWNALGSFGVLYLCGTRAVAAAVARTNFLGEIATLLDILPSMLPDLLEISLRRASFVDAVSDPGLHSLGLPQSYPYAVDWKQCQPIGQTSYAAGERGIASRSAAEATPSHWIGEELALFDTHINFVREGARHDFDAWYERP